MALFSAYQVIDVATLTGACIIALGKHHSGVMSNSDDLADSILTDGIAADDSDPVGVHGAVLVHW